MNLNVLLRRFAGLPCAPAEKAGDILVELLSGEAPAMVARFGSVEIKGVLHPQLPGLLGRLLRDAILGPMANNAGFFPATPGMVKRFSEMMVRDMALLDVLGSWRIEERLLSRHFPSARPVALEGLEPYLSRNPWTRVLEGRKVLVVHPFDQTIERQYAKHRQDLFADPCVLPRFASLSTVRAVQTIAGTPSGFADWFEALDSMKAQMDACDYDVAILGCGAYGFPLAAHAKRMGRKAVHLGGPTQILFGIRGRRWDDHPAISRLYNEHWVRPAAQDVPQGAAKVENGCYW